jgi:hypothetical protein
MWLGIKIKELLGHTLRRKLPGWRVYFWNVGIMVTMRHKQLASPGLLSISLAGPVFVRFLDSLFQFFLRPNDTRGLTIILVPNSDSRIKKETGKKASSCAMFSKVKAPRERTRICVS